MQGGDGDARALGDERYRLLDGSGGHSKPATKGQWLLFIVHTAFKLCRLYRPLLWATAKGLLITH